MMNEEKFKQLYIYYIEREELLKECIALFNWRDKLYTDTPDCFCQLISVKWVSFYLQFQTKSWI